MNTNIRFSKSDLITAAGIAMRPLEIDDKGGLFERLGQPGITERLSHEELSNLLRRPDTSYVAGYFDRAVQDLRGRKWRHTGRPQSMLGAGTRNCWFTLSSGH